MTEDRFGWPYGVFYNRIVGILQLTEDDYTVRTTYKYLQYHEWGENTGILGGHR
jgi:hypothetical protein